MPKYEGYNRKESLKGLRYPNDVVIPANRTEVLKSVKMRAANEEAPNTKLPESPVYNQK